VHILVASIKEIKVLGHGLAQPRKWLILANAKIVILASKQAPCTTTSQDQGEWSPLPLRVSEGVPKPDDAPRKQLTSGIC
jgi:hypothetical protein